jgi:hypothetical protein
MIAIGVIILVLFASLVGCEDDENIERSNNVPQEQFDVTGARIQITDTTQQQEVLGILMEVEQETISDEEALSIIRSPQNQLAMTIEFRIDDMWYSFHETGVLTVHRAGDLAEYFLVVNEDTIKEIFALLNE